MSIKSIAPLLTKDEEKDLFEQLNALKTSLTATLVRSNVFATKVDSLQYVLSSGYDALKNYVRVYDHPEKTKELLLLTVERLATFGENYVEMLVENITKDELLHDVTALKLRHSYVMLLCDEVLEYDMSDCLIDYHVTRDEMLTLRSDIKDYQSKTATITSTIVTHNMGLVAKLAKNYSENSVHMQFNDLIQEGNIGLLTAIDRFDHMRGHKFSTYATYWIREAMIRAMQQQNNEIRVPVYLMEKTQAIKKARENINREFVTLSELSEATGIPKNEIHDALASTSVGVSLQAQTADNGTSADESAQLQNFLTSDAPSPEEETANNQLLDVLQSKLNMLSDSERGVIVCLYGLNGNAPKKYRECAVAMGMTSEDIRLTEETVLTKLKNSF